MTDRRHVRLIQESFERREREHREVDDKASAEVLAEFWYPADFPVGTVTERYLASRAIAIDDAVAIHVIRHHAPSCSMIVLYRDCLTLAPRAVTQHFLRPDGKPQTFLDRKGKLKKKRIALGRFATARRCSIPSKATVS